ncbi:Monocarboxylate permease [Colletotrichum higginsianum IMI 349063]|uniref:Monocarboxylate permease n=1 Tax=Colletotrichum higginsianum (strain IMI 349063) TaxID=759273 RepID=A0A1B7XXT8_COLHI|nr:Monocarboxylate permease [Colletotrichum higginsianum IMI 349063]OBR04565.1 Monocarboxylate permease [Colletotrichum higginsianum IMI 349063]
MSTITQAKSIELTDRGRSDSGLVGPKNQSQAADDSEVARAISDREAPRNATEAIPDGGYGWTIVASNSMLLFWINGYTTAWGVLQTNMLRSGLLKTDVSTITFVGSLYMACMVAFSLVSVRLMGAFGVRYTTLAALSMFSLGLVATSFTLEHVAGLFCVAGLFVGCGGSLLFTATNTLPIQWFSSKLGTANGLVKAGGGVGATVLPLAAQALINNVGLPWTFRIFGLLTLVTGVPCVWLLKERTRIGTASRFDWSMLKDFSFLTLTIAGGIGVFALFVPPFFLPLFASSIGLSSAQGAGLVAGFGASTAVGRLFGGWFCDHIGAFNALSVSALINSLSMMVIWPVSSSLPLLAVFAVVNGCANGSFFVGLPTAVGLLTPGSAAASISLMTSFWTPGYLLGAPLAGILINATGAAEASSIEPYRAAIFYAAGVGAAASGLIIVSRMRRNPRLLKRV